MSAYSYYIQVSLREERANHYIPFSNCTIAAHLEELTFDSAKYNNSQKQFFFIIIIMYVYVIVVNIC